MGNSDYEHGLLGIISMSDLPPGLKTTNKDKHNTQITKFFVVCLVLWFLTWWQY